MKLFFKLSLSTIFLLTPLLIISSTAQAKTVVALNTPIVGTPHLIPALQGYTYSPTEIWLYNLPGKAIGETVRALDYGYSDFFSKEAPTKVVVGSVKFSMVGSYQSYVTTVYSLNTHNGSPLWTRSFGSVPAGSSGTNVVAARRTLVNLMSVQDRNADNFSDIMVILQNDSGTIYRYMLDGQTGDTLWHDSGAFTDLLAKNQHKKPLISADIDGDNIPDTVDTTDAGVVRAGH